MESLELKIFELFRNGDALGQKAFIKECPSALGRSLAIDSAGGARLDLKLMILNGLVESYSGGLAPELGVAFSKAIFGLSQEAYFESGSRRFLAEAARAAVNCAVAYRALGEHDMVICVARMAEEWLDEQGLTEYNIDLLLFQAEAGLELGQYELARELLVQIGQEIEPDDARGRHLWYMKLTDRFNLITSRWMIETLEAELPESVQEPNVDHWQAMTNLYSLDNPWLN